MSHSLQHNLNRFENGKSKESKCSNRAVRINQKVLLNFLDHDFTNIKWRYRTKHVCDSFFVRLTVKMFNVRIHHPPYACITLILNSST